MDSGGWYFVGAGGNPVGPYDETGVQGLLSGGYVNKDTSFWKEGLPEWQPMGEIPQLKMMLKIAAQAAEQAAQRKGGSTADDELAVFQAEIQAIEAEATAADAPASPEEKEFEDDDGTVYVWDSQLRKFVEKGAVAVPGPSGAVPEAAYDAAAMTYEADDEVIPTLAAALAAEQAELDKPSDKQAQPADLKRKAPATNAGGEHKSPDDGANKKRKGNKETPVEAAAQAAAKQEEQPAGWFELKVNTSIYITGLPHDVTVEEMVEAFSKFGVIKEDDNKQPRVKLYRDKATGQLKGDALVTYLKEPSVALAVQLMDGVPFRPSQGGPKMMVQPAKFEMKGDRYQAKDRPKNKKALKAQLEKQEKLLGWAGFDDKLPAEKVTVILENMFHPDEFLQDMTLSEDLEREVFEECNRLGPVEKVRVFKINPAGVISVRFKKDEGVQQCIDKMNGRFFAGRQVKAYKWDGVTNYNVKIQESAEEQQARLEAFARELEKQA